MALSMSVGTLPPPGNMHQNITNLQGDHFNLLESDPLDSTNASDDGQCPTIRSVQVSASPGDPNGSYGSIVLPPVTLAPVKTSNLFQSYHPPPVPSKPKRSSHSLPNSVTSSPRSGARWRHSGSQTSPREGDATPSFIADRSIVESDLRRSKSCSEGRASSPPSIDLDAMSNKLESPGLETCDRSISRSSSEDGERRTKDEFKCGALCLFLPGFGKARPARAKNKAEELTQDNMVNISRTVSLERFECGSWASSTIIAESKNKDDGDSSTNLYFDLPLELIRSSGNDVNSPMTATFIFDNQELRGVLKSSSSTRATGAGAPALKLHESSRHVRFSTSTSRRSNPDSPSSCITPRLMRAREDFNAFLEAQGA